MQKKILVSVWEPLLHQIKQKVEEACLRRDQYLSRVLRHESAKLLDEVSHPNSADASAYIAKSLTTLPRKTVNLLLDADAADDLNAACEARNVPRDAFVNRILLFLVAGRRFFESEIEIDWNAAYSNMADEGEIHDAGLGMLKGGLSFIAEVVTSDPFQFVRRAMYLGDKDGMYSGSGLHGVILAPGALGELADTAVGFNCRIDDSWLGEVRQTSPALEMKSRLFAELLGDLKPNEKGRKR